MKIKGWKKTLELPYRIDYYNTAPRFNYNKSLGISEFGIIISRSFDDRFGGSFLNTWEVSMRRYIKPTGTELKHIKTFETKQEAIDFAILYMKKYPIR